jgi:hypothetical protein
MKRTGRKHLPKVGTRPNREYELHERRGEALHPFSADPSPRRGKIYGLTAVVVGLVAFIGILALIAAT